MYAILPSLAVIGAEVGAGEALRVGESVVALLDSPDPDPPHAAAVTAMIISDPTELQAIDPANTAVTFARPVKRSSIHQPRSCHGGYQPPRPSKGESPTDAQSVFGAPLAVSRSDRTTRWVEIVQRAPTPESRMIGGILWNPVGNNFNVV
jgi:hypothetical protein